MSRACLEGKKCTIIDSMSFRTLGFLVLIGLVSSSAADKPNVVWILSEDNSKHYLRLFDPNGAPTPNIEAMAKDGLVFNHAFSNAPVCSVARTTLITGCYAPRIGTQHHRRSKMAPMPEGLKMFPAYLREAGYHTTNNSKTDYNATPGKGVWDASSSKASWRDRKDGQPFFHQRTFGASHESSLHFSLKKMLSEKTSTDPASVVLAPYHPDTPTFRYTYARFHDRIRDIDAQVGNLISELTDAGVLENTFIFYFGDHGGVLPRGKGYAYESGLHVPLVVRVPQKWKGLVDHKRGDRLDGFVSFIDFGPTLLNLAGIKVPEGMDGRPFLGPGITAAELAQRDEAFGYADRFDEKIDLVRTLRKGAFKYMRSYWPHTPDGLHNDYRYRMLAYAEWRDLYKAGKLTEEQMAFFRGRPAEMLFDLSKDPHETDNLAASKAHAEILADMRGRLTAWVKGMPDLSFYPETHLMDLAMENPVAFGKAHREELHALIDLADLQLVPFSKAKPILEKALRSKNPRERHWGYVSALRSGPEAGVFAGSAKKAAVDDPDVTVRQRATEFLGLTRFDSPVPGIMAALKDSPSEVATNEILNTAVLLHESGLGHQFSISKDDVKHSNRYIDDRLNYLAGNPPVDRKAKKKRKQGATR